MKKIICCVMLMLTLLCGCGTESGEDEALRLRAKLNGNECSFDVKITADYGDEFYEFQLSCIGDRVGNLQFCVISPENIANIRGSISSAGGKLEFEDTALAFALLADGLLSPVSAPWVMMKALIGGYILSAGPDGEYCRVTVRDSYEDNAMTLDIWLQEEVPVHAEIYWENRRILTMELENFKIG